ncbi:carbonic anhydrase [Microbacterium sp. P06]|uniref:carbonic anhydrase n=1 Tax=Microbacterium sp. P06 TaxID=3366949 RepID=UPI00374548F8
MPKNIRSLSIVAAIASVGLALTGCATGSSGQAAPSATPTATPSATPAHWTYEGEEGPSHWGELAGDYELCETGTAQSPIDLTSAAPVAEDELSLAYGAIQDHIINTGHTYQLVADEAASVEYDGTTYTLLQMHFHDPSEHTVDGEAAPVEFHFVHADDAGNLLVVGVMAVEGAENAAYSAFIDAATAGSAEAVTGSVDLAAMVPADLQHFSYPGSLTTPPCSEDVQWIVMQTPVELSAAQIGALEAAYGHNSRPVQPLNGREVGLSTATVTE